MTLDELKDKEEWLWNLIKIPLLQNEIEERLRVENITDVIISGDYEIPDVSVVYSCGTSTILEGFLTYRIAEL